MSRVHWSKTYLYKAGALDSPRRGVIRANSRTKELLGSPGPVNNSKLLGYPEFQAWLAKSSGVTKTSASPGVAAVPEAASPATATPHERLDAAFNELKRETLDTILEQAKAMDPSDFEKLVLQLLTRLGYGGAQGSATHLGQTGDGGIDGLINEDRLGLDRVYIQAKRWSGTVGAPEIQAFVGSLVGRQADRGVFLTTAEFSGPAQQYVRNIAHRVVLIDGPTLAELMWETNLGVSVQQTYALKIVDRDFFETSLD